MNYKEAEKKAFKVKWKTEICSSGKKCWCRIIAPAKPIFINYGEIKEEFYILSSGSLSKEFAEYFVKLHNKSLK